MMIRKTSSGKRSRFGRYSKKKQKKNSYFKKKNFRKQTGSSLSVIQRALRIRDTSSINQILETAVDVNSESLLHSAVRVCKYAVVKKLIDAGANVNSIGKVTNNSYCYRAIFLGPNHKSYCICTPLIIAIKKGYEKIVALLIQNNADPNLSCSCGSPLSIAVEKGTFRILKLLLRSGADINAGTSTYKPLHTAISKNNYTMVKYLIKWKADLNILGKDIYDLDCDLYTPLQIAILKGNVIIMKLLINSKAKIDSRDNDETILHFSLRTENPETINFCIINTVDVNAVTPRGRSALHIACQNQISLTILSILLDAGVDINLKDINGKTVLEYHNYNYFGGMLDMIKQHNIKLKALESNISKEVIKQFNDRNKMNSGLSPSNRDNDYYYKKCLSELEVMKTINVKNTSMSFYQILKKDQHQLALLLMDITYENYYSEYNLRLKFPIYGGMIFYRLGRAFNEKKSLDIVNKTLHTMFKQELPDLVKRSIYNYFNYKELTMLSKT